MLRTAIAVLLSCLSVQAIVSPGYKHPGQAAMPARFCSATLQPFTLGHLPPFFYSHSHSIPDYFFNATVELTLTNTTGLGHAWTLNVTGAFTNLNQVRFAALTARRTCPWSIC